MGKTRVLSKEIGDTEGKIHAKIGTTEDKNGKELREAEETKKRHQEYTEELYKKGLNDPDNHNGEIVHLEPDILECAAEWALGTMNYEQSYWRWWGSN